MTTYTVTPGYTYNSHVYCSSCARDFRLVRRYDSIISNDVECWGCGKDLTTDVGIRVHALWSPPHTDRDFAGGGE